MPGRCPVAGLFPAPQPSSVALVTVSFRSCLTGFPAHVDRRVHHDVVRQSPESCSTFEKPLGELGFYACPLAARRPAELFPAEMIYWRRFVLGSTLVRRYGPTVEVL